MQLAQERIIGQHEDDQPLLQHVWIEAPAGQGCNEICSVCGKKDTASDASLACAGTEIISPALLFTEPTDYQGA